MSVSGSGNFSSSVSINSSAANVIALDLSANSTGGVRQRLLNQSGSGLYNFQIGSNITTNNAFEIIPSTTTDGTTFSTAVFKILNTGAATFSSSVTATQLKAESSLNGDPELATFTNSNAGTGTEATIYVRNSSSNNDGTFVQALGTAFTTTGGFVQDGGVIGTGTGLSGGLSLMVRANADMRFYTNGHTNERMRITSGGNVLIGTTTDNSYKLAVASGHQYLGSGFQITGTFGQVDRQCATAFADFSGTTCTFDLASLFPRTTFLNRGLSVTMQLVALPTYTIVSSAFVVLGRTGNSNVWSNSILANININGAAINSVSASGTVITVVYSTYIFGTAYINLATIG
jgi:hypothetical protein